MNLLFSFNGRIARGKFWLGFLLTVIVMIGSIVGVVAFIGVENLDPAVGNVDPQTLMIYIYPGIILGTYMQLAIFAKRLHDIGKTGWLSVLVMVPIISLVMLIWLGVAEGVRGDNEYGADPRA